MPDGVKFAGVVTGGATITAAWSEQEKADLMRIGGTAWGQRTAAIADAMVDIGHPRRDIRQYQNKLYNLRIASEKPDTAADCGGGDIWSEHEIAVLLAYRADGTGYNAIADHLVARGFPARSFSALKKKFDIIRPAGGHLVPASEAWAAEALAAQIRDYWLAEGYPGIRTGIAWRPCSSDIGAGYEVTTNLGANGLPPGPCGIKTPARPPRKRTSYDD